MIDRRIGSSVARVQLARITTRLPGTLTALSGRVSHTLVAVGVVVAMLVNCGPDRAREAPVVRGQPAGGQLRIGVVSASTARACRPYDLRYPRPSTLRPSLSDLWWKLGENDQAEIALDRPFVTRRIAFDLYHWVAADSPLCRGEIDVAINDRRAIPVSIAAACQDGEHRARHVVTLDLDQPTLVVGIRLRAPIAAHARTSHYITLKRVTLIATPVPEPPLATVIDVWAEVHEMPPGIPAMGLWALRPGLPPRAISGALSDEPGYDVGVWAVPGSSQVFLAELYGPPPRPRELYTLDAATEDTIRLVRRFDVDIHEAWYDECADALTVELSDHTTVLVPADRRAAAP